jgi:hypothetical protein
MLGFQRTPKDFETWLANATRGLCAHSRKIAGAEFEDHYAAACEDLESQGLTGVEVTARALSGLGDPRKLRRRLKRIYLTTYDEMLLNQLMLQLHVFAPSVSRKAPPLSWPLRVAIGLAVGFPFLVAIGLFGALFVAGNKDALLGLFFVLTVPMVVVVLPVGGLLLLHKAADKPTSKIRRMPTLEAYLKYNARLGMYVGMMCISVALLLGFDDFTRSIIYSGFGLWSVVISLHLSRLASKLERHPSRNESPAVIKVRKMHRDWRGVAGVDMPDDDTPRPA